MEFEAKFGKNIFFDRFWSFFLCITISIEMLDNSKFLFIIIYLFIIFYKLKFWSTYYYFLR